MKKLVALPLLVLAIACKEAPPSGGLVQTVQGSAEVEHAGKRQALKVGDRFESGDTIYTGDNGVVVVAIRGSAAMAEIQPNSTFNIETHGPCSPVVSGVTGDVNMTIGGGQDSCSTHGS